MSDFLWEEWYNKATTTTYKEATEDIEDLYKDVTTEDIEDLYKDGNKEPDLCITGIVVLKSKL